MAGKRKRKGNGPKKGVSQKVQESEDVSDTPEDVSDSETEEESEDTEEGTPETPEDIPEPALEDQSAVNAQETEEKKSPVPDWKLAVAEHPSTYPGKLVFKFENNLKIVVNTDTFLRWVLSPAAKE